MELTSLDHPGTGYSCSVCAMFSKCRQNAKWKTCTYLQFLSQIISSNKFYFSHFTAEAGKRFQKKTSTECSLRQGKDFKPFLIILTSFFSGKQTQLQSQDSFPLHGLCPTTLWESTVSLLSPPLPPEEKQQHEFLRIKLTIRKHTEQMLSLHDLRTFSADPAGKSVWLGLCNMPNVLEQSKSPEWHSGHWYPASLLMAVCCPSMYPGGYVKFKGVLLLTSFLCLFAPTSSTQTRPK